MITGHHEDYNPFVVFVDCKGCKKKEKEIEHVLKNGFKINGKQHMVMSEKSASMGRNAILGFVDKSISKDLDKVITMDIEMKNTVISKYTAYRGLMFSSCFCIEDWIPKVIVVDDYERIIPNQHIRYVTDKETEYVDKNTGEIKIWKEKDIVEGYADIPIMPFDGCGLHHPEITKEIIERLELKDENPTSVMWRFPFVKGVTHEFNYTKFFLDGETKVTKIKDIWNEEHDVTEPMIILTRSMYKGYKYFQKYKDVRDWNLYWEKFKKYNHCIGVAKWNYSIKNEPVYTRANYQILQDLELEYDDFLELSDDSLEWASKIIDGDKVYTYCFLGLLGDNPNPRNDYMRAVLKNPEMLKEESVRKYLINLLKKYIDEFKCGKLWLKSTFRILTPDLIMLAEYIGGLEPKGILKSNEFYSKRIEGVCEGEYLIERNPHICASEHVILNGINNSTLEEYCNHLEGIVMINSDSVTLQKLNSADVDGDLALVLKNSVMMQGVDRTRPTVIDMEDKITVPEEEVNIDNIIKSVILSMDNRIGEYSNVSTGYHNKNPHSPEQKEKYMKYIDLVSILNGKEIDAAKTGVRFNLPKHISKYAKPLPYFMKYAGEYYRNMKDLSKAKSLLNRLCWDIEKWQKKIRFKRTFKDFNYHIMIDNNLLHDDLKFQAMEELYLKFEKEMSEVRKQNAMRKNHGEYANYFGDLSSEEILNTKINWGYYYNRYKELAENICPSENERANYAVELCYGKYKNKGKKFIWTVATDGILSNLKQQKIELPIQDDNGKYEYLGRLYNLQEVDLFAQ
jgi:hypothetical protein